MAKDFPKAKYKLNEEVSFKMDEKVLTGRVFVVDKYGTFEQNEEPSYDIMVENSPHFNGKACLYKHIRQSIVVD